MASGLGPEGPDDTSTPRLSLRQRILLSLPRLKHDRQKAPLGERLRDAFLKPAAEDPKPKAKGASASKSATLAELESEARYANDMERLIGLLAAPIAAIIAILVISDLISNDPSAFLKTGQPNRLHVPVSDYHEVVYVLLGLSILILATAWFRKRLYLGMVMALYGLAIFNLKYWGFGVPYVLVAAWLLVRAYRLQRDLREATASGGATRPGRGGGDGVTSPATSKRYTPRTSSPRRQSSSRARSKKRVV